MSKKQAHFLSGLTPNEVKCKCGNTWTVSQVVQKRPLDCLNCGRFYQYKRELGNKWKITLLGTFQNPEEREIRTYAKGLVHAKAR